MHTTFPAKNRFHQLDQHRQRRDSPEEEAGTCTGTARTTRKRAGAKNAFKQPSSKPRPAETARGGAATGTTPPSKRLAAPEVWHLPPREPPPGDDDDCFLLLSTVL